jgi:magnesium/cobalt transport protein CorA
MQILHFMPGHAPELAGVTEISSGTTGFFWLDIERSESDWHSNAQHWLGTCLHERHIQDTLNETHPPYYDGTDDYDLLVVSALCPDCPPEAPATHPIAFIVASSAIISVRPPKTPVFGKLHRHFLSTQQKSPTSPTMLLYLLLDQVTDTLLARRDVTSETLSRWEERLLNRSDTFGDWQALMKLRGQLRRLETVTENQLDAIGEWREQTSLPMDPSLAVRFNDLQEHLRRVYNHAIVVQHDIDALVQIYFSSNTQRTNEILQFLTIVSAVFLPLNLLAGLFGMNFANLPLLQAWYGPWIVALLMFIIITGLLFWFRRRHWI